MQTQTVGSSTPAKSSKLRVPKKTVDAVTGTPDTKAAKAPKAKAEPKAKTPSKFVSRDMIGDHRMRVAEYQDYTFSINDRKDRRLTDAELCKDWQTQFPNAVQYVPNHVTGARRDYNLGRHSKAYPTRPATASQAWFLVDGAKTQTAPKAEPKPKAVKAKATTDGTAAPAKDATANPKGKAARKKTAA